MGDPKGKDVNECMFCPDSSYECKLSGLARFEYAAKVHNGELRSHLFRLCAFHHQVYQNGLPAAQAAVAKELSAIEEETRKLNMSDENRRVRLRWERNQIGVKIFFQLYSEVKNTQPPPRESCCILM
jgi:hypothetical protein